MKNKKGYIPLSVMLVWAFMAGTTAVAVKETHDNGVLRKNGKKIWCKMQNKGADYCDAQYQ